VDGLGPEDQRPVKGIATGLTEERAREVGDQLARLRRIEAAQVDWPFAKALEKAGVEFIAENGGGRCKAGEAGAEIAPSATQ
jgi:hypothetical protein